MHRDFLLFFRHPAANGQMLINKTVQHVNGKYEFRPPKTVKSRRTIAIPAGQIAAKIANFYFLGPQTCIDKKIAGKNGEVHSFMSVPLNGIP